MAAAETCFVIMPFGKKPDAAGEIIDFDLVYKDVIQEPVEAAGLEPLRCDDILMAGSIHRDMWEGIAAAPVAVVDLTTDNPNVFYELGVRHALRASVTVLIRKRSSAAPPFNIGGLRIIEYPSASGSYRESRDEIAAFIRNGLASRDADSPIHEVLAGLRADDKTQPIVKLETYRYRLRSAPERRIAVRTGAIQHYTEGMDVWVNSENTHLQMARYFDRSLSAVIRYWGARKDVDDEVVEDTIADELAAARGERISVAPGSVLVTGAGALAETHGVQRIFHVASVMGVPGQGWVAVPNVWDCVTRCLRLADSDRLDGAEPATIAFPMLGTGHGGVDVYTAAPRLIQAAMSYLREHPRSRLATVYFMAWNGRDLEACLSYLDASDEVEREQD